MFLSRPLPSALLIAMLVAISGCQQNVKQLNAANPPADTYSSALAAEYQAYADSEAEQGRHSSAEYFAGKGLKVLKGEDGVPEQSDPKLPVDTQQKLSDARAVLVKLLTDDIKHVAPQKAARSQLLFDCWQNQEREHLTGDKALCSEEFTSSLNELQEVADFFGNGHEVMQTVNFNHKSTEINNDAHDKIASIAKHVAMLPEYTIELEGYADKYGTRAYNQEMAEGRVEAVRNALVEAGVPEDRITAKKQGEEVILSSDKEAHANRRSVDITIRSATQAKEPKS